MSVLLVAAASEGAPREPDVDDTHRIDLAASMRVPVRICHNAVSDFSADDQQVALAVAGRRCRPRRSRRMDHVRARRVSHARRRSWSGRRRSPDSGQGDPRFLAHALIDSRTRTSVLATVFIDRTRRVAADLGLDHRVLLGRAIAHELGHLLLATPTHGSAGLMREVWSRSELLGAHAAAGSSTRPMRPLFASGWRARSAGVREARPKTVVSGCSRTFTRMVAAFAAQAPAVY